MDNADKCGQRIRSINDKLKRETERIYETKNKIK